MQNITIEGIVFNFRSDKGSGIIVYDEDMNELGVWDDVADLRYDVEHNPEWFKKEGKG